MISTGTTSLQVAVDRHNARSTSTMRSLVEEFALCVAGYERLLKSSAVGPISKVRGTFWRNPWEPQPAVSQRLVSLPGSPRQRTRPLDAAFMKQEPELAPACGDIWEATLPQGAFGWWRPPRAPRRPRVRPLGKRPHSLSRPHRRLWRCAASFSRRSGQVTHGRRRHGFRFEAFKRSPDLLLEECASSSTNTTGGCE